MGSCISSTERLKIVNPSDDVTAYSKHRVNKDRAPVKRKRNNKNVSGSENVTMSQNGKEFIRKTKDAQMSDHGTYMALTPSADITVQERLKIVKPFDDVTVYTGRKIVLKCGVNKDGATAKWKKNNKNVSGSKNVTMSQNGKRFILTIKEAQMSDHGTYTCEVTFSGEKVTCSADITVQGSKSTRGLQEIKYFTKLCGKTLGAHEGFTRQLQKKLDGLTAVPSQGECDFILAFCPIVSRAGTDITAALKQIQSSKYIILVVFHHTLKSEECVPDSRRFKDRETIFIVDCLFHEDLGFLRCQKNSDAVNQCVQQLNETFRTRR